ncbi:unnamed protein product [Brassica rapa]|uniref:Uncharacterized protein n=1 Tax=Brassica campestris TaxID=3711 RepID=A0A8D9GAD4_BRACM|nr:unnamed protein product [Brassica rapa]
MSGGDVQNWRQKNILQCGGVAVPLSSVPDTPFCQQLRCDGYSELLRFVVVLPFGLDLVISQFRTGFQQVVGLFL